MRIIVAGGGIGGLITALTLHRIGFDVQVFESVPRISALGVGINLLPHSVRVLDELSLTNALKSTAIETEELIYFNKHGQRIWTEPRGLAAGYPWPQFSIHRGDLQMILLKATREIIGERAVIEGHALQRFEDRGDYVECELLCRERDEVVRTEGDVLIGADGIHSTVRATFYPDEGEPLYAGRTLWRAVSDSEPFLTGRSMIMAGNEDQKFVAYPISKAEHDRGGSTTNWIAELATPNLSPDRSDWNRAVSKSRFSHAFSNWTFDWLDVPRLIDAAEIVYEFPLIDRDPVERWSFGRVTLLGDAAHPMYPIGSNGASQAILDAHSLALAFLSQGDAIEALKAYEDDRLSPTANIVRLNRKNGPEQVMQLAEERSPQGFENIEDVIPIAELEEIALRYKQSAGFDLRTLQLAAEKSSA